MISSTKVSEHPKAAHWLIGEHSPEFIGNTGELIDTMRRQRCHTFVSSEKPSIGPWADGFEHLH